MPINNVLRHLSYNLGNATRLVYDGHGDAEAYLRDEALHTDHRYEIRPVMNDLMTLINRSKGTPEQAYYDTLFKLMNSTLYDSKTLLAHLIEKLPPVNRSVASIVLPSSNAPTLQSHPSHTDEES